MILLNRGVGKDWAGPFSPPPPPPLQNVTSFLIIFKFTQPFHCIYTLMIEICQGEIQVYLMFS